jgi:hypothetical protein
MSINGVTSNWTADKGISALLTTAASSANTKFEVNVPVSKAGEQTLSFSASLGLTRTFSKNGKKATLAVPKTVFTVGEPIPVYYSTSGISTSSTNHPWIGITKNVGSVDKYIAWQTTPKNTSGVIDLTVMPGGREDNSVLNYVHLPAGEYKIYFVDENANQSNSNYWLHDEPINISIVNSDGNGTTVTRSGAMNGNASISVSNTTFCVGGPVKVDYTANNLTVLSSDNPWLAIGKRIGANDYYSHWAYTARTESGSKTFTSADTNNPQTNASAYRTFPSGSYTIYYLDGSNINSGAFYTEPIGINIAPKYTVGAKLGTTQLMSAEDPYALTSVSKKITVTDADVAKGYITVSFDLTSLPANTQYYFNVKNVSLV